MGKYVLGADEAEAQIEQFCEWYGIDLEDKTAFAENAGVLGFNFTMGEVRKAFRKGYLEVQMREDPKGGETIVVVQHLSKPIKGNNGDLDEITYYEITGGTKAKVKIPNNASETGAMWSTLAACSNESDGIFNKLRGADIGVAQVFGFLYSQV